MHALIIEDEDLVATVIEDVLRDCGFTSFDIASTAKTAIEAAGRRAPDLVTSDVRLAQGSGIDAVEAICAGPAVPVVFVTAHVDEVAQRLPDIQVVAKPFSETALTAAVASAMLNVSTSNVPKRAKIGLNFGSTSIMVSGKTPTDGSIPVKKPNR